MNWRIASTCPSILCRPAASSDGNMEKIWKSPETDQIGKCQKILPNTEDVIMVEYIPFTFYSPQFSVNLKLITQNNSEHLNICTILDVLLLKTTCKRWTNKNARRELWPKNEIKQKKYIKIMDCNLMNNENVNAARTIKLSCNVWNRDKNQLACLLIQWRVKLPSAPVLRQPWQRCPFWVLEHWGEKKWCPLVKSRLSCINWTTYKNASMTSDWTADRRTQNIVLASKKIDSSVRPAE